MKIDLSPRQSGKTTRMLQTLARDDRYVLLTFSKREVDRLRDELHQFIDPRRIMYWRDYAQKKQGKGYGPRVLVDNADLVLEDAINDYVDVASITSVEKNKFAVLRNERFI